MYDLINLCDKLRKAEETPTEDMSDSQKELLGKSKLINEFVGKLIQKRLFSPSGDYHVSATLVDKETYALATQFSEAFNKHAEIGHDNITVRVDTEEDPHGDRSIWLTLYKKE
jgi:hypothetical protein